MDIATKLNLETGAKLRNTVADLSDSNIKVGTQVGKLSKEVFAEKINKSEEVVLIKNLGHIIPSHGDFKTKFEAVLTFFSKDGTCPLVGLKEVYALSIKFSLVYIRLWTRNDKFKAEQKIKDFRIKNPNY